MGGPYQTRSPSPIPRTGMRSRWTRCGPHWAGCRNGPVVASPCYQMPRRDCSRCRQTPGVPNTGIVAVCDFGGSGTSLSLVDAANGYQAIASAARNREFSGERIDQALLTHVIGELSSAGSFDTSATSAIGSLTQLRTACRYAKERLSSTMETQLTVEVPGYRGDIRLTRSELEDAIREPLDGFNRFFQEVLQRNGISLSGLAAVASVGGGASIPMVTRSLSEQSGALIITAPRPHLIAAVGAALRAARGSPACRRNSPASAGVGARPAINAVTGLRTSPLAPTWPFPLRSYLLASRPLR